MSVVVLGSSYDPTVGGQVMRWRALTQALAGGTRCELRLILCTGALNPDQLARLHGEVDRGEVDRGEVELVVCSGLETHAYLRELRGRVRVVFDMHNVEQPLQWAIHEAARDYPYFADIYTEDFVRRTAAAEAAAIAAADEVWVCSADDLRLTLATYPGTAQERLRMVPNAVTVSMAEPPMPAPVGGPTIERVCFLGRFDYLPIVMAAETALGIAPLVADLPVVVAGRWAGRVLHGYRLPPNVRVVADPGDTASILQRADLAALLGPSDEDIVNPHPQDRIHGCRAERVMRAATCSSRWRSFFGSALVSSPSRSRCWVQAIRSIATSASCSQAWLIANTREGKRPKPVSLPQRTRPSTRAWARRRASRNWIEPCPAGVSVAKT